MSRTFLRNTNCYGQPSGHRARASKTVAELGARPLDESVLLVWLWNVCIAPDADTATRNAAAIEHRAIKARHAAIARECEKPVPYGC